MLAGSQRSIPVPSGNCGIPGTARAYSLNVTVVPSGPLAYLTIWPTGQQIPNVSTLNSLSGAIVANAAIVPAGTSGAISVFVTNNTDVIIDINGYFVDDTGGAQLVLPGLLALLVRQEMPEPLDYRARLARWVRLAQQAPRVQPVR
jgi:hypothetical protein